MSTTRAAIDGFTLHDREPAPDDVGAAVREGLSRDPKSLPCKLLYDERGSRLFEEICRLPEYYPTRTETGILQARAAEISSRAGPGVRLVELGSGSSTKTRILLDALERPAAYVPVDIARSQLLEAASAIGARYPGLRLLPVCQDYTEPLWLPPTAAERTLAFFPGSTIGNFEPDAAEAFLRGVGAACGPGSALLIGVDLKKDRTVLEAAYDDSAGVTAEFNLNLLERLRRECGVEVDPDAFRHRAVYDERRGRIEMHLVSDRAQRMMLPAPGEGGPCSAGVRSGRSGPEREGAAGAWLEIELGAGEAIVTEHSYKYSPAEFAALAERAGYRVGAFWTDPREWFGVFYLGWRPLAASDG